MASNTKLIYDGYVKLVGVNGSRRPMSLPRELVHRAFNCTFRGDEMQPRPGIIYQPLTFENEYTRQSFHAGRFQEATVYESDIGESELIISKGGKIFRIDPRTWVVQDISITQRVKITDNFTVPPIGTDSIAQVVNSENLVPTIRVSIGTGNYTVSRIVSLTEIQLKNTDDVQGTVYPPGTDLQYYDLNPGKMWQVWMCQAEKWLLIQDGESRCIIYDGAKCRRAGGEEIPIGKSMAYGNGRIWLAMPDGNSFTAGDLIYGSNGTDAERKRDAILKWKENSYLAGGNSFTVPVGAGQIRGMKFISNLDTSLGQGPLQVFTVNGSFSVAAPTNRQDWTFDADNSPVQTVSLTGGGCESDRSLVTLNSDIMFRSKSGIRSFQIGRQSQTKWVNTPMSKQVDWAIVSDQPALLKYSSAVQFDQRFVCTCAPMASERGVLHQGFVALDFQQVTWLEDESPQWDGLWTAVNTYRIVTGEFNEMPRCYIFSENGSGEMELYELSTDRHHDQSPTPSHTRIRWGAELSAIAFPTEQASGYFDLKALEGGEMGVRQMEGEVEFKIRFRPDGYDCWIPWVWWRKCAVMGACASSDWTKCRDWEMGRPQAVFPMGFGRPPDGCDVANGRPFRNFYAVQTRIDIRGYAVLSSLRLAANQILQPAVLPPIENMLDIQI